jgi:hypothetical protein
MSPAGIRTKEDCAGEGQQQFNRPTDRDYIATMMGRLMNMERKLGGGKQILGENLLQYHFFLHKQASCYSHYVFTSFYLGWYAHGVQCK